jgi:hypothetical protein
MSSPCPPTHEAWQAEWLARGPEGLSTHARAELEACPHCRGERDQLGALQAALARDADDEREALDEVRRRLGEVDPRWALEAYARRVRAPEAGAGSRTLLAPLLGVLCIAASIALLFLVPLARQRTRTDGADETHLGQRFEAKSPRGRTPGGFGRFRWSKDTRAEGGYRVTVLSNEPGTEHRKLHSSIVTALELVLPPELTEPWPDHIEWTVEALDAGGNQVAVASAPAWRER